MLFCCVDVRHMKTEEHVLGFPTLFDPTQIRYDFFF